MANIGLAGFGFFPASPLKFIGKSFTPLGLTRLMKLSPPNPLMEREGRDMRPAFYFGGPMMAPQSRSAALKAP